MIFYTAIMYVTKLGLEQKNTQEQKLLVLSRDTIQSQYHQIIICLKIIVILILARRIVVKLAISEKILREIIKMDH